MIETVGFFLLVALAYRKRIIYSLEVALLADEARRAQQAAATATPPRSPRA